jgi:hypothetical protein
MPLRDVVLYEDDRMEMCERQVFSLLATTLKVGSFRQYEVRAHAHALKTARDRLTELLDRAD